MTYYSILYRYILDLFVQDEIKNLNIYVAAAGGTLLSFFKHFKDYSIMRNNNIYKFSIPMPFYKEHLDKVISINKNIEKSKITSLYFSLPTNSSDFTGFEQDRFYWDFETDFEFWKPLIEYSLNNNFDFIYVLNSPVIYYEHYKKLPVMLEKLDKLLNNLRKTGINKVRVCNPQLMGHINKYYSDFELFISTSSEMKIIKEYTNLFSEFKNIKECVPSWDINKNFKLLKNLRKLFPQIKLELMVNEGCIPACSFRIIHNNYFNGNCPYYCYSDMFFIEKCSSKIDKNLAYYFTNTNIIYPWEIKEYSKIGISNFKLVGRNSEYFKTGEYIDYYNYYLKGIDNINYIKDIAIKYLNNHLHNNNINYKVSEIMYYLPDIKHFTKFGHLCSSICGTDCKYCYKCAEKIQKVLNKQEEKLRKKSLPICKCS